MRIVRAAPGSCHLAFSSLVYAHFLEVASLLPHGHKLSTLNRILLRPAVSDTCIAWASPLLQT